MIDVTTHVMMQETHERMQVNGISLHDRIVIYAALLNSTLAQFDDPTVTKLYAMDAITSISATVMRSKHNDQE